MNESVGKIDERKGREKGFLSGNGIDCDWLVVDSMMEYRVRCGGDGCRFCELESR